MRVSGRRVPGLARARVFLEFGQRLSSLNVVGTRRLADQYVNIFPRRVDGFHYDAGYLPRQPLLLLLVAALSNIALDDWHLYSSRRWLRFHSGCAPVTGHFVVAVQCTLNTTLCSLRRCTVNRSRAKSVPGPKQARAGFALELCLLTHSRSPGVQLEMPKQPLLRPLGRIRSFFPGSLTRAGLVATLLLLMGRIAAAEPTPPPVYDGMPNGTQDYAAFVKLWDEFLYWRDPKSAAKEQSLVDVAGLETDVYPDYGSEAIAKKFRQLRGFQDSLDDFAVTGWPIR